MFLLVQLVALLEVVAVRSALAGRCMQCVTLTECGRLPDNVAAAWGSAQQYVAVLLIGYTVNAVHTKR